MYKAKERASILWLLSKAYNKKIPKELKDPYYKNASNEEVLKPQIVQGLTTCEMYCMALSFIYEDLSYADLDHIGVIHLLIKKGVQIVDPTDIDLTETALIQNAPIRMSAHMAIIDAMMNLFSKDVLIPEKIVDVVTRFAHIDAEEVPLDIEEVALFWLNKSSECFRQVIEDELNNNETESITYIPCLPFIQDITELNTGCSLVALLSFYCPDYLNWREVCLKEQDEMTEDDCIKNLETVQYFCSKYLPYDICFIETINFLRIKNQMRINLLTFIADLLYLFEVKPAQCVRRPEYDIDVIDYDFKENERINHNNATTTNNNNNNNNNASISKKLIHHNDLIPVDLTGSNRTRSQHHHTASWTNDEDEDNLNEEIRNQQKRLRSFIQQQQQQQTQSYDHHHPSYQSPPNEFYLNENDLHNNSKTTNRRFSNNDLNHDLQSLNLNKDSESSENEFYLNQHHHASSFSNQHHPHHNNNNNTNNNNNLAMINSDGSETSSTLSFAKLSKIKNCSISNNLNDVDSPSINVVYSSDQDDYLAGGLARKQQQQQIKKRNSAIIQQSNETQLQASNGGARMSSSEQDEAEIANQILQIHMKLEEKKKQIELEKKQVDAFYKTQKRDISNEAFLKALKIEKMMNNNHHHHQSQSINSNKLDHQNDLSAYEIKKSLNSLKNNLPSNANDQLKSDQYYNDIKSSIDILSSSVIDLEKDLTILEEQKMLVKQQKHNLDQLMIDQQQQQQSLKQSKSINHFSNVMGDVEQESKFYLHTDKPNQIDNQLTQLLNNNKNHHHHHSYQDIDNNYIEATPKSMKIMKDSLTLDHQHHQQSLNSSLRRTSLQSDNNLVNNSLLLNNNDNNEKGFFIPLDDNSQKKPRSKPPVLGNYHKQNKGDTTTTGSKCQLDENYGKPDAVGFVIGHDLVSPDPKSEFAKAKKKEFIMNQSMKRKAEQEEKLRILKDELNKKGEEERKRREQIDKRKEENRLRREAILEQHRLRKLQEDNEKESGTLSKLKDTATMRNRHNLSSINRTRPKSIHISSNVSSDQQANNNSPSLDFRNAQTSKLVSDHLDAALIQYPSSVISNFHSTPFANSLRPQSSLSTNSTAMKKLYMNSSSKHNLPSLPPFMLGNSRLHKGSGSSDGVSEIGSTYSEYTGPKLYVKPIQKSNRGIIVNAINVVLGGAVNVQTKKKVLEEINNNDSKHFLILFRGSGMQFRAIYTYNPDLEEVVKLYGTGPKLINNDMIDKFYKYNSGGKNFNEVHTKHLTVTIDAITIHSALWSGKKIIPKKDSLI